MNPDDLNVLSALLAVADERSFTRAAKRLGVTQSALSHSIRALEERLGVRLLARTTRSVAPTDAGAELVAHVGPALADIRGALEKLGGLRDKPAGRVRLLAPRLAAKTILGPKLGEFARRYPDIVLDITTDDSRIDLVAGGYDAGIQFGEFIAQDMVAVRVSADHRPAIVGSRRYFKSHPTPKSPRDLLAHRCINFRHGSEGVYRWEFDKGKQSLTVAVNGPLIVDDVDLVITAALDGVGLAFLAEQHAEPHLTDGTFVRVLQDWCPPFPGYFLYYPSRRQQPAALSAVIDTLRLESDRRK
jgi:DNA-binding transcriptional LysR family regulator